MFGLRPDWKSRAANQLSRMGLHDSAKSLYGIDSSQLPVDERPAREWREMAKRRSKSKASSNASLFTRIRMWLGI